MSTTFAVNRFIIKWRGGRFVGFELFEHSVDAYAKTAIKQMVLDEHKRAYNV